MRLRVITSATLGLLIAFQAATHQEARSQEVQAVEIEVGVAAAAPVENQDQPAVVDRAYAVDAPALTGIKIDGDISDWPAAMPRYSLRTLLPADQNYSLGGLDKVDLTTNGDLSACFSVGYDVKEQVILLAIIVRDDALVVGNKSAFDTDAVEIFIDGLRSNKQTARPSGDWDLLLKAEAMAALQYVGAPGKGPVYKNKSDLNVVLQYGEISKTKTKMAWSRKGDVTIYEWAVQPVDSYPDKPSKLEPGKRIGFELAVIDRDVPAPEAGASPAADRPAWLCWGLPPRMFKGFDAENLGELVLSETP